MIGLNFSRRISDEEGAWVLTLSRRGKWKEEAGGKRMSAMRMGYDEGLHEQKPPS